MKEIGIHVDKIIITIQYGIRCYAVRFITTHLSLIFIAYTNSN